MYLLLIFLSIVGSCLAGLFGKHLGSRGSAVITTSCLFFSFLLSLFVFYEVALVGCFVYVKLAIWISSEVLHVDWGFMFDSLTASMCVVVTFISFLVHFYSVEYMSHDPHLPRFMSYLSLFTFFMLILVTADNFLQMFVGWEGVGLCSYLLINFWFTRIQANKAAIKAMLLNRIGDFSLLISIFLVFVNYKSVDYATVAALTPFLHADFVNFLNFKINILTIIGLFMFIGATGKSAQLVLHTWLPDAMEGPTPVSALIHAATMVTAGVFLIVRCSMLFEYIPGVLKYIVIVGAATSFFAATTGLLQNDLKRVIAYSTCSQLGYMVFACGLSNYSVGFFHLTNHAFFKALLFLSAGSVIHAVNDEQDMRKMGGLKNLVPFTYSMLIIGSLALIGFPFLAGFYSKDLVLEVAYGKYSLSGYFSYYLGTLGAFFTAFYSMRLVYLTFLSRPTGHKQVICFAFDSGFYICVVLASIAIPSIFVGYYIKDMFVGVGSSFFGTAIFVSSINVNTFDGEFISVFYKTLPVSLSILGFFSSYALYNFGSRLLFRVKMSTIGKKVYYFLNRKWFFDKIYKCGVLTFQCFRFLRHTDTMCCGFNVGHFLNHLANKKVSRGNVFSVSTGKRIFVIVSPNFRASKILGDLYLAFLNNLDYKMNDLSDCSRVKKVGWDYVSSQELKSAVIKRSFLKYDYKNGIFFRHLGTCEKLASMRITELELITTFQGQNILLKSVDMVEGLAKLWNLKNSKVKHSKLISILGDQNVLRVACEITKLKFGNITHTVKSEVLCSIHKEFIKKIARKILSSCFKFKNVRRIEVFQPIKRILIIGNFKDRVVQQAVSMILEQIFETKFLRTSHGFRGAKGCHSALKQIQYEWLGISWFLEFDIYKHFDVINKRRLINILRECIDDLHFLGLISQLFNSGVVGWVMKTYLWSTSVFKSCVVSSILCNIYLHKLDLEVCRIQKKLKIYNDQLFRKEQQKLIFSPKIKAFAFLLTKNRFGIKKQQKNNVFKTDSVRTDLNFITLFYVRYIDDFLFGVAGPKSLVLLIKKRVVQFVKSDLKLELVGGEVTHVSSGKVSFLGIKICRVSCSGFSQRFCNALEKRRRVAFKSVVQQKVKEGKNLKVLQLRLKKLVEKSVFYDVKGLFNLKFKFQGIKKGILFNNKFVCPDIMQYKKFIKRFYLSQAFVPDSFIRMLRMFENELTCWKKAYQRINLNIFARKRKKLTVKQTLRALSLYAPMQELKEKLKLNGLLTKFNRPAAVNRMLNQKNHIIVGWFHSIAQGFLEYYRCCHNFVKVKNYVEYFVRWSAIHTLAKKHSSSCSSIVSKWSKNLVILNLKSDKLVDFPDSSVIKTMGRKFLSGIHLNMGLLVLNSIWLKFSSLRWFALKCSFKSCSDVSAIEMYPINNLSQIKNSFGFFSVAMGKSELLKNSEAFTIVSTANQIPFCKNHYKYLCTKKINLFALDWDYLKNFE